MTIMKKYIDNWDKLTDEQKKEAEKQFVGNPGLNTNVVHPAAKFFEEHRWVKIDKFIDILIHIKRIHILINLTMSV